MGEPVQRRGVWWQERPDGTWLRWSEDSQQWEEQAMPPPPPEFSESSTPTPAPPPAAPINRSSVPTIVSTPPRRSAAELAREPGVLLGAGMAAFLILMLILWGVTRGENDPGPVVPASLPTVAEPDNTVAPVDPAAPAGPTRAEFRSKANSICRRFSSRLSRPDSSDIALLVEASKVNASLTRQMAATLGRVPAPRSMRASISEWLSQLNLQAATLDRVATAFAVGSMSHELADELTTVTSAADSLAYRLGLRSCVIQG